MLQHDPDLHPVVVAARQLRDVPVRAPATLAALALLARAAVGGEAAAAEHPGRYLESRRAAAPVVYLATVTEVREVAAADAPGAAPRMEATLKVDRLFRPATPASPAPADAVVRYEQAAAEPSRGLPVAEDMQSGVFYRMSAGDRAVVFAG